MASTWTPSTAGDESAKEEEAASTLASEKRPGQFRKRLGLCVAILALMFLAYLLGAAVISFQLPSSEFLRRAFLGARAWNERRQLPVSVPIEKTPLAKVGSIDKADKTFDGFTLYTCASITESSTQTFLVNMRGEVVHRWAISFSKIWPSPSHIRSAIRDDLVCFFDNYLYPNGDLLVTFHGLENRANGYGLAKLDKDSNVIWKCSRNIHHDVEVAEDGTIYAIAHKIVQSMPRGLEDLPTPSLIDELIRLSPDGKEIAEPIPILEAFRDSPYAPILGTLVLENNRELPMGIDRRRAPDSVPDGLHEPLHMNCVRELPRRLAAKYPTFEPGQLLISMRNMDTIAVVDPHKRSVVWAARGPWRAQHDAQFLDNGHLLIFDNAGSPSSSRVLEYEPQTQSFPWWYPQSDNPNFYTMERGMSQRLPNGNTLIVSSQQGKIWEVTPERETVWTLFTNRFVHVGRRYAAEFLTFLAKGTHARP
jgi:hypothetical protein